ncbi:MAG TPA: HPr family phosphocarrier protein [Pseudolabrys sp.]|nr:HPr family phosphocarrier protein [Pseudolabrys sp.]
MSDPEAHDNSGVGDPHVVTRDIEIINKLGLHARAAMKFVQTCEQFKAAVTVTRGQESVDGASILDLLMLAAAPGSHIVMKATGREAQAAMDALCELVASGFGETD